MSKPIGRKAYGSIPHLPSSRLGPADHYIHPGQATILTEKARDKHDRIIVTEKLDGACVAVARHEGQIIALGRSGYAVETSPYEHLRHFGAWVAENERRFAALEEGERLCGEWIGMAHGTLYKAVSQPFVPFDLMAQAQRFPIDQMMEVCGRARLVPAHIISDGPPLAVEEGLRAILDGGFHGAIDPVEGCVWRCERRGKFEFIAKFVQHSKIDGMYFTEKTGVAPIFHWRPTMALERTPS